MLLPSSKTPIFSTPEYMCIPHLLAAQADRIPNAPAIVSAGRAPLTYDNLHLQVVEVATLIYAMGLSRNDRVALVLPNGPEMVVAFLAMSSSATCVPLNPAYSANEFDYFLTALHIKALIVQTGVDSPSRTVAREHGIAIIELSPMADATAGLFRLTGAVDLRKPTMPQGFAQPNDVALVLHTAGTTSRSKIVPLTHANLCTSAHYMRVALELRQSDRCLNVLPLFHMHGLMGPILTSLVAGASVVCTKDFSAPQFFAWLDEFSPTWYTAVPTIHQAILECAASYHEIIARHPLRFIRSGSAPLPTQVMLALESVFHAPMIEIYGMTETSGHLTCNPLLSHPRKVGSVGLAAGPDIAIIDEIGNMLPTDTVGEVVARGATVMQGYENDPLANSHTFINGWFRTGDQGYLDSDGYLFVTGRFKELINRGGEKIAPQEVDAVLMDHPAVAQAVTFSVPHARLGEDVVAAVVLHQNVLASARDIREFAATRLAAFKVPRQVYIVDSIPQGPTGKVQRLGLAERINLTEFNPTHSIMEPPFSAQLTPLEELLIGLWAQILHIECVGVHDNFFQMGGDSILFTQLAARMRETLHVEVSLQSFFELPTIAGMARYVETARHIRPGEPIPLLQSLPRDRAWPLSYAQERLWFLDQLDPGNPVYNLSMAFRLTGVLNLAALENSLSEISRRHDILRTIFPAEDGQPAQVVMPAQFAKLPLIDMTRLAVTARESAMQQKVKAELQRPFDLARGPLWRATLLRLADQEHALLLIIHHIIFDGWSFDIFFRELSALYSAFSAGRPSPLEELSLQYSDFTVWQRAWLQGSILETQLAYWKAQLSGSLPLLELLTDYPRLPLQTYRGAYHSIVLPQHLTEGLKMLSQQAGVTLFITLLAIFKTLLYRYTAQEDILIGTPISGRTRIETESLIGFFVNTLVLRTDAGNNPSFQEMLGRVREVVLSAYDHQDLPFKKVVETLQPERNTSHVPLFQVMFAMQNVPYPTLNLPGLMLQQLEVENETVMFDLALSVRDTKAGLQATLGYSTDLFDGFTINAMLRHFQILAQGVITHPEQRISELSLLTAAERQQLLGAWNPTTATAPQNMCIHQLFQSWVVRSPGVVAVSCAAEQLTYDALNRRANQLAHFLHALGVGPEVCVGLYVERSLDMIVGILGILKSGGAYIPLDPLFPPERLALMVDHAQVLVTQQRFKNRLPENTAYVVCMDTDWERIARERDDNLISTVTSENLAYVMFTSGSTGEPKGVMIEHRRVLTLLHGLEHVAPGGRPCVGTAVCSLSFDVSVWEFFSILCFGGTLHIILRELLAAPEHFVRYLLDHHITSAYIPSALLSEIAFQLEQQDSQMMLNRLLSGVEPIKQGVFQRFRNLSKSMRIINGYGPTETTICATLFRFDVAANADRRTPIGTAIPGYELYVVDSRMQLVPPGTPGELLIGGSGLARGYLNQPSLTAERFIPHLFRDTPQRRLYKTGDRVRSLPDGNLEFLGRSDQQIKLRGYRIELDDIEAALRQHPDVQETVVLLRSDDRLYDTRLVAYLVSKQQLAPTPYALRSFLKQKLPEYMVPSAFVTLDALPQTPHGKINRQVLPAPDKTSFAFASSYVAPRDAVEKTLVDIWLEVLGLEQIGIHDNFFALGGDSILSIQIIARGNQKGLHLTPKQLFQHQTIAELAMVVDTIPAIHSEQGLVTGPVPLTPSQHWFFEQDFSDPHHWNQTMLLEMRQPVDVLVLQNAVQYLLAHHDMLRARFKKTSSGWQQYIINPEKSPPVTWKNLSGRSEKKQAAAIASATRQLQSSLNLTEGPLIRFALFHLGLYQHDLLLVAIHHLVIDSVSWRTLLTDLQMACEQLSADKMLQLPAKTYSFKHWAEQLAIYAQSDTLRQEAPYWLDMLQNRVARLPIDYIEDANTVSSARTISVALDRAETRALLQDVPKAYQTHINDILLTALGQAFAHWTGDSTLLIDLEGHGREEIVPGVDLSRTVGWFTTIYPVLLHPAQVFQPAKALKAVKEQLRSIPNRGIGYGLLRYYSQNIKLRTQPQAQICFNYLGQVDQILTGFTLFRPAQMSSGPSRSLRGHRHYLLEINGRIADRQLQIDWIYSEHVHRRATIEELSSSFMEILRELIEHCQSHEAGGYTPSDFPNMKLSQKELDHLITTLDDFTEGTGH